MSSPHRQKLKYRDACTSKTHIKRHFTRMKSLLNEPSPKKVRCSSTADRFIWKELCVFCAKPCNVEKDYRHPDHWQEAYLCRTSDRDNIGKQQHRKTLLDICDKRGDAWAEEVRIRLNDSRAISHLHAADARYHEKCRKSFTVYEIFHVLLHLRKKVFQLM